MHLFDFSEQSISFSQRSEILQLVSAYDPVETQPDTLADFRQTSFFKAHPEYASPASIIQIAMNLALEEKDLHPQVMRMIILELENLVPVYKDRPSSALNTLRDLLAIGNLIHSRTGYEVELLSNPAKIGLASMMAQAMSNWVNLKTEFREDFVREHLQYLRFMMRNLRFILQKAQPNGEGFELDFHDVHYYPLAFSRLRDLPLSLLSSLPIRRGTISLMEMPDLVQCMNLLLTEGAIQFLPIQVKQALEEIIRVCGKILRENVGDHRDFHLDAIKRLLGPIGQMRKRGLDLKIEQEDLAAMIDFFSEGMKHKELDIQVIQVIMLINSSIMYLMRSYQDEPLRPVLVRALDNLMREFPESFYRLSLEWTPNDYFNSIFSDQFNLAEAHGIGVPQALRNRILDFLSTSHLNINLRTEENEQERQKHRYRISERLCFIEKLYIVEWIDLDTKYELCDRHLKFGTIIKDVGHGDDHEYTFNLHDFSQWGASIAFETWWNWTRPQYAEYQGYYADFRVVVGRGIGTDEVEFSEAYDPVLQITLKMNPLKRAVLEVLEDYRIEFTYSLTDSGKRLNEGSIFISTSVAGLTKIRARNASVQSRTIYSRLTNEETDTSTRSSHHASTKSPFLSASRGAFKNEGRNRNTRNRQEFEGSSSRERDRSPVRYS